MEPWSEPLLDHLRRRILAAIHRGGLRGGDRLPSVRALAEELGRDHRAVAKAYRTLDEEGLVEVRPRSGVYLRPQERMGSADGIVSETAAWLGEVLYQAWQRDLTPGTLASVLDRLRGDRLRVVCVETVRDPLMALADEVERITGPPCGQILLPRDEAGAEAVLEELLHDRPDLVLTTAYHAALMRKLEAAGVKTALLHINPAWVETLRGWATGPGVTMVTDDVDTGPRLRTLLRVDEGLFGPLQVDELDRHRLPPRRRVLYATRLARTKLPERWARRARVPREPLFDASTVRSIARTLVLVGLGAEVRPGGPPAAPRPPA